MLELSLTATDLLAWTQTLLLEGELATAEPKKLRYRLLHAAARITRGGRRLRLRIAATWPWRQKLINAFVRLTTLPAPDHLNCGNVPALPPPRNPLETPARASGPSHAHTPNQGRQHQSSAITPAQPLEAKRGG